MDKKKPLKQPQKKANNAVRTGTGGHTPIASSQYNPDLHLIFLCVIIAFVSFVRYRYITIPFERDEGEYGYIGSLFLHGIAPFKNAYSMKLPGTSFMYAVLMTIFGHTSNGVHLGMVFINAATMVFLFTAFKKLFSPFIGLTTASIYGLLAIGLPFEGYAAHATQFICLYSSVALLFLADFIKSNKSSRLFLFGLMLGMAFLMKQQALFLILFGGTFLFIYLKIAKQQTFTAIVSQFLVFGSGVIIPFAMVVLIIMLAGQFPVFWLWTVKYASSYETTSRAPNEISIAFQSTFLPAWDSFYYLWLLALVGLGVLFWTPYSRLHKLLVLIYCIASVCVFCSGFYFRQHYYIVLLPAIGLLSAITLEFIIKKILERLNVLKPQNIALIILSILILFNIDDNRKYYFSYVPSAFTYGANPFNQAQQIAKYIKNNTNDTDKIAILGSEPEIYFYANRMAATGFLYTYPLVENQPYNEIMQEQMIKEIENSKPKYLLYCNISPSWVMRTGTPTTIFDWGRKYTLAHYATVGFVDFYNDKGWQFYLGDEIKNHTGQPESVIMIFKRNDERKL